MKYSIAFDIDLKKNSYKGKYIAFEGIDGSGKTTQVKELARFFAKQGKEVILVQEPRKKGLIGDLVHRVLRGEIKIPSTALQYLFTVDRVLQHSEVISPALKAGKTVISDRSLWSAVVYGILDRARSQYRYKEGELLLVSQSILSMYHQFIVPDYTFYLRISLPTALTRILGKNEKREIYEDKEKLTELIKGYNWLVKKFSKEIVIIDGEKSVEDVSQKIIERIQNLEFRIQN